MTSLTSLVQKWFFHIIMEENVELRKSVLDLFNTDSYESNVEELLAEYKVNADVNVFAFRNRISFGSLEKKIFVPKSNYLVLINCLTEAYTLINSQTGQEGEVTGSLRYEVKFADEKWELALKSEVHCVTVFNFQELKKLSNGIKEAILTSVVQDYELELALRKILDKCKNQSHILIDAFKAWKQKESLDLVFVIARHAYPVTHPKYDKLTRILVKEAGTFQVLFDFFYGYVKSGKT